VFVLVAVIDRNTPNEFSFSAFYSVPALIAAFGHGLPWGLVFAMLGGISWLWTNIATGGGYANPHQLWWNLSNQTLAYAIVAVAASKIRGKFLKELALREDNESLRLKAEESEARFRALTQNSWDVLSVLDSEGRLIYNSPSCERIHGFTAEELVGKNTMGLIHPEDAPQVATAMEWVLDHPGEPAVVEYRYACKDGRWVWMEAVGVNHLDDPAIRGIITNSRDVSARKQAELERTTLQTQIQQAQKMDSLGTLAGGVAHDFNNMLGGVMGYADLLLASEEDPKRQKYLRSIVAAASRSADLTQKLLAFGRRGKNLVESLQLKPLVEDCLSILRPAMNPDLKVVLAMEDCPTVDGDPSQLHQVVLNLCLNAIEAMPEGGTLSVTTRSLEVETTPPLGTAVTPGNYVELRVTDTGLGMIEDIRQRVFEPFFTTKNTSGMSGTGLGLSTAFGIVHAHHGAITVESTRGKGSTFRVLLPMGVLPNKNGQTQPVPVKGAGSVLLVEDEPILLDLGTTVLESLGFEVIPAEDGLAAVAAFQVHHLGLCAVLLDLKMPKMGGREAFLEFQKLNPGVPVIICTGFGENEEVQDLITRGAAGMLAKPYQIATMAAKLKQVTSVV